MSGDFLARHDQAFAVCDSGIMQKMLSQTAT
jgi:hypothetical protein